MMIETHGSMMLSEEAFVGAEANFRPLATFMVIVPALAIRRSSTWGTGWGG
jgi:hypothetical protein